MNIKTQPGIINMNNLQAGNGLGLLLLPSGTHGAVFGRNHKQAAYCEINLFSHS